MAKKSQIVNPVASTTEPGSVAVPEAEETKDLVKPRGVALKQSEWSELDAIGAEMGLKAHRVAQYAVRDFLRRWRAGEIDTVMKKSLP